MKSNPNTYTRVSNVTHFGAFVDLGVGKVLFGLETFQNPHNVFTRTQSGLIHSSKMGRSGGKLEVYLPQELFQKNLILTNHERKWHPLPPGWTESGGQGSEHRYCQRKNWS